MTQLASLRERLTPADRRRRAERIARRAESREPRAFTVSRPRRERFIDRLKSFGRAVVRKMRRENREKAFAFAGNVAKSKALLGMKGYLSPRCPYQRQYVEKNVAKLGAPCQGKLERRHRQDASGLIVTDFQCKTCGRVYAEKPA